VFPGTALCDLRPELAGESGRVESTDGEEVLVQWNGHRRLYRLAASLVEKGS
jgi:hypothetical protein